MKLVDRYILREIAGYAGLGLGVFLFILMTPEVLRLSELLARENIALPQLAKLFLSVLPGKLLWAIPLSVLAALLMAMSRLAADSEVIALQAAGVSPAALLRPMLAFAALGACLTLAATVWWGPLGARTMRQMQAELAAGQATYEVQPRVFDERFPNLILYVQDTSDGGSRWKGVFLADLTQPDNPRLTLAQTAVVVPEPDRHRLRLHLFEGSTHAYAPEEPERYSVSTFAENVISVFSPASSATLETRRNADLSLAELWAASQQGPRWRSARVDFHRRLAIPAACLLFGVIALPLGLLAQGSGRALGFVVAVGLAIGYYFVFLLGDRLGREGGLPPGLGAWLANMTLAVAGLYYFQTQWSPGKQPWSALGERLRRFLPARSPALARAGESSPAAQTLSRDHGPAGSRLPRTLDLYVVRGVLFYSLLLLCALLLLFGLFAVLEMVEDIAAHHIPWPVVARFLWYLLPQALYWMAPLALLLGVLVELALLSKRNELVAIKGAGISLYRIAVPLLLLGLVFSALLFWLDYDYLPYANQRQEILRNQIKGRPPQTFFQTERRWIFGQQPRIYHYAFFDPAQNLLARLSVLELDPQTFSVRRRLSARQAHWEPQLHTWVLEQGWEREFGQGQTVRYRPFQAASFRELTEAPAYFQREVRESAQMNWQELGDYITGLHQSGFDVTRLQVQRHKKIAFPLISTVMVLLAFPFGLSMGRRGAVGGLALGIGVGFAYWVLASFFEQVGNLGYLPPVLAAWGANLVFLFAGVYLLLQIET